MTLLANARMYSVTPATRAAWAQLFDWVIARSRVGITRVDHDPPLLLSALWERDDLGAVMMCGLPLSRRSVTPTILAQPVPSPARYAGRAVYGTDIVVAAASPCRSLTDTFGSRAGYTLKDSQSGYVAFRHHLLQHHAHVAAPYPQITGGLMNARGVIQAIAAGRIDVGPLDGYVHDLLRHSEPHFAAQVRIVATTEPTPMPPIVATATLPDSALQALREAFQASIESSELTAVRETLLLKDFALPEPASFALLRERADRVDALWPDWP